MKVAIIFVCFGTAAAFHSKTEILQKAADGDRNDVEVDGWGNLCMKGHLAPMFFLLGTPKSGTTYFFEDFVRSDQIVSYKPGPGEPEWHAKEPWVFSTSFLESDKENWVSHYPLCKQSKHVVAVDCTPGYFGSQVAPFAISHAYNGVDHNLVFMVFLREPVERAHSHYYQFLDNGVMDGAFSDCTPKQFPATFKQAVENQLTKKAVCNCGCDSIFAESMYVDAFRRYFAKFSPSSFHVVPFKFAVLREVVEYAWKILRVNKGHGSKTDLVGDGNQKNHHTYPSLEQEMSKPLRSRLKFFIKERAGPEVLAKTFEGRGVNLFRCKQHADRKTIARWLQNNW